MGRGGGQVSVVRAITPTINVVISKVYEETVPFVLFFTGMSADPLTTT